MSITLRLVVDGPRGQHLVFLRTSYPVLGRLQAIRPFSRGRELIYNYSLPLLGATLALRELN